MDKIAVFLAIILFIGCKALELTEILLLNRNSVTFNSEHLPWIELYNEGEIVADLTQFSLSADCFVAEHFNLPISYIRPEEFEVVFLGDCKECASADLADMNVLQICQGKETVFTLDGIPSLRADESYGLARGTFDKTILKTPSPGDINSDSANPLGNIFDGGLPVMHLEVPSNITKVTISGNVHMFPSKKPLEACNELLSASVTVRTRGSKSADFPKPQYAISLNMLEERSRDLNNVCGLPFDASWVLNGPYVDKTLLRNAFMFDLSRSLGIWSPRTRFIEMYLTVAGGETEYRGIYILMEKPDQGKSKVHLEEMSPYSTNKSGGYLFRVDKHKEGDKSFFTTESGIRVRIVRPNKLYPSMHEYCRSFFQEAEDKILNNEKELSKYIDLKSWVDSFFIVELSNDIDGFRFSTFLYKPKDQPIFYGPQWDYHIAFGNANFFSGQYTEGWRLDVMPRGYRDNAGGTGVWFTHLLQSQKDYFKTRWNELRRTVLSNHAISERLRKLQRLLPQDAIQRNFDRWGGPSLCLWANPRSFESHDASVAYLETWLWDRLDWMDCEISNKDCFYLPNNNEKKRKSVYDIDTEDFLTNAELMC
eukprot:TRINITY_DN6671_c0_g2_i1.p1 TRINITY_DN6671_c0_g2~~TRINITY_DN6671_c0_g2_i1.p1  ORF type:complete len:594 (+),score=111.25 TRINITY_DN6671_c0_g2_i1:68-1849(+)